MVPATLPVCIPTDPILPFGAYIPPFTYLLKLLPVIKNHFFLLLFLSHFLFPPLAKYKSRNELSTEVCKHAGLAPSEALGSWTQS